MVYARKAISNCISPSRENGLLKETKSELEHAIAETERPLRINNECIKNREARISIDLVKDEVQLNMLNTNLSGYGRIRIVWSDPDSSFGPIQDPTFFLNGIQVQHFFRFIWPCSTPQNFILPYFESTQ